jgi:hypothetical protein
MKVLHCATLAVFGLLVGATAQAAVITFDDIPNTGNGIQTSVSSTGFNFNGDHFHIVDSPLSGVVRNASTSYLSAEAAGGLGRPVTMTRSGGGVFTLNSVEVAELWLPGIGDDFFQVSITGNVFGGGLLNMLVTLDGIRDGAGGVDDFQIVNLVGWTNLTSVVFTGVNALGAFGDYSIDNIVVDSVPEPVSFLLFGVAGAVSVGRAFRRRR